MVQTHPPLAHDMLASHIQDVFEAQAAANAIRRAAIRSAADWDGERRRLLAAYRAMLGPFPERTPLLPRVTGVVRRERYDIEKVLYESRPGHLVTAALYLPRGGRRPAPGVLVPCGHSENGKAAETYQRVCAGLASKGYVVLIYDPIGQGERKLYWNAETGASDLGGNTTQHSYAGNQCFLLGINLAQYMVWDSVRAVDYLVSRPEVDPARIAMAGNSGGGTNTAYTVPLDERIRVAVSCCYITTLSWRRRVWSTGDAEQDLLGQLPAGLDHADFLRLMAPRPALVGSAALDFFPLEGARESVAIARELYQTLGVPDRIDHAVVDAPHGYSVGLRRATYRWLNRWLKVDAGDDEPETPVESDEVLQVTAPGQVEPMGSPSIFALNLGRLQAPDQTGVSLADRIARLTGFSGAEPGLAARPDVRLHRYEGQRRVEVVTLWPEAAVAVPGMVYRSRAEGLAGRGLLWLDGEGVAAAHARPAFKSVLATLVPEGWTVLAVDVRGTGETATRPPGRANPVMDDEALLAYETFVCGRPLFGMRLLDASLAATYLASSDQVDQAAGVTVVGWGRGGLLALHLGVLHAGVGAVAALDTLASYRSVVEHERYDLHAGDIIPGVVSLAGYDLDDLAQAMAPRPVLRLRQRDHLNRPLTTDDDETVQEALLAWLMRTAQGA